MKITMTFALSDEGEGRATVFEANIGPTALNNESDLLGLASLFKETANEAMAKMTGTLATCAEITIKERPQES